MKLLRYSPDREQFPQIIGSAGWAPLQEFAERKESVGREMPDPTRVTARIVQMTPNLASELLARGGPNRRLSSPVIAKYARDMAARRWRLNGHTIKLSREGRLLDGQHRLEAARRSGATFEVILVEGLEEHVFSSLDIGRRRGMADLLNERGEVNTMTLAAALRWVWIIKNGVVQSANVSPTNTEMLELLEAHPDLRMGVKAMMKAREIMGGGLAAALYILYRHQNAAKAEAFFDALIYGQNLSGDNPAYILRERLIRTRASHRVRLAEAEKIALVNKAWVAFQADRPIQVLSWRKRGAGRESVPTVI